MSDKFKAFTKEIMETWPNGGIDGFELEDLALKHEVLVPTKMFNFCSPECECSHVIEHPEVGFECFRLCEELRDEH